jgi:hypothetical protein
MSWKSTSVTLAVLAGLLTPVKASAQDAGVSGIPRGPGSVGGLNNSVNDPSGRGNAIQAPPPPSMAVPVTPSSAPLVSSRLSPRSTAVVRRANRRAVAVSRRDARRGSAHARGRQTRIDRTLSICRGC